MAGRILSGVLGLMVLTVFGASMAGAEPNIILIIGDDHGWPYYGFQESSQTLTDGSWVQDTVQTPNLDSLADSGTMFSRGFATGSVCVPSLQTLLSAHGHHWLQWLAMMGEVTEKIPLTAQAQRDRVWNRYAYNLPRRLREQGYRSWEGGKLWAGLVADSGFDEGLSTSLDSGNFRVSGGSNFGREGWSVDTCGSTAVVSTPCPALDPLREFFDGVQDEPFFVWFAPMLPHTPWDAPAAYRDPLFAQGLNRREVDHLANIRWFDELLGELMLELEARGLREDTLLIYLSDNGWGLGLQNFAGYGRGKGTLYDIGFRTPIIFSQPGIVPSGEQFLDFVSFSDIPATILDYAGAAPLDGAEGESLRARVEGGAPVEREGFVLFSRNARSGGGAWVDDRWRYLQFDDGREELYRIDLDPFEENDLARENPDLLERFAARVDERRIEFAQEPETVEVRGQVRDRDGRPIGGAHLRLSGGPYVIDARTGEDGWFRFARLPVSEDLRLQASRGLRGSPVDFETGAAMDRPFLRRGLFLPLRAASNGDLGEVGDGRVSGRVVGESGEPVAYAAVSLRNLALGQSVALDSVSAADGTYFFENLPEVPGYELIAMFGGGSEVLVSDIDLSFAPDALDVDLSLFDRGFPIRPKSTGASFRRVAAPAGPPRDWAR